MLRLLSSADLHRVCTLMLRCNERCQTLPDGKSFFNVMEKQKRNPILSSSVTQSNKENTSFQIPTQQIFWKPIQQEQPEGLAIILVRVIIFRVIFRRILTLRLSV
mmetsp:Transcript_33005/g.104344  ORF Transcript_33005/g.104344 Transcript_33005/m.104344 type:complete len:105 (-) Transcript_33005:787-1101(-)